MVQLRKDGILCFCWICKCIAGCTLWTPISLFHTYGKPGSKGWWWNRLHEQWVAFFFTKAHFVSTGCYYFTWTSFVSFSLIRLDLLSFLFFFLWRKWYVWPSYLWCWVNPKAFLSLTSYYDTSDITWATAAVFVALSFHFRVSNCGRILLCSFYVIDPQKCFKTLCCFCCCFKLRSIHKSPPSPPKKVCCFLGSIM